MCTLFAGGFTRNAVYAVCAVCALGALGAVCAVCAVWEWYSVGMDLSGSFREVRSSNRDCKREMSCLRADISEFRT